MTLFLRYFFSDQQSETWTTWWSMYISNIHKMNTPPNVFCLEYKPLFDSDNEIVTYRGHGWGFPIREKTNNWNLIPLGTSRKESTAVPDIE